jgi:hypothetical protein
MGHTLYILTAGLLIGQFQESAPQPTSSPLSGWTTQTKTWTQTGTWTPATGWTWQIVTGESLDSTPNMQTPGHEPSGTSKGPTQNTVENPKILSRIGDRLSTLFSPKSANPKTGSEQNLIHVQTGTVVTTMEPPLLEAPVPPRVVDLTQPGRFDNAVQPVQVQDAPTAATRQFHLDGQFTKVGHNAEYSVITGRLEIVNGAYFVHYATPDSGDRFGGRMILTGNLELSHFRTADLIRIRGIVMPGRTISLYQANHVELVERTGK